ncbi:MAG: pyridoxal-phosphate dependent enzyme [Chloroflexi bacterium]|nr:pyridoxal-phosphate dependent enzyme [Chloroflexota bacterium]
MTHYHCSNCHRPYPEDGSPHLCLHCGGVFSVDGPISYSQDKLDQDARGLWRYRYTFGLSKAAPIITLGEGDTPLAQAEAFKRSIHFKLEFLNPTGSFKDRGTAPLISELLVRGVERAVEDSSGNAGASFAAYAARAGIGARVFVPDSASGPKRAQIEAYGAELVSILGPRSEAASAVRRAAEGGEVYASHALLPYGLAGIATIAYELVEQLGQVPGCVIAPVGHGSLLLGLAKGFEALRAAGIIEGQPQLIGVQARACAPLWAVANMGAAGLAWMTEGQTLAEGVRVSKPARGDELLRHIAESQGSMLAVEEEEILAGRDALAGLGFYVEPTSAIVWGALEQVAAECPDPIVVLLSGSGLKAV